MEAPVTPLDWPRIDGCPRMFQAVLEKDSDNIVEGPLKALLNSSAPSEDQPSYVLQLVGHGKGPALSLEPDGLDLGAVKACETLQRQVDPASQGHQVVGWVGEAENTIGGGDPQLLSADGLKLCGGTSER
ncbi:unnamed protein product [Cladocopium goreaui]|uniref:Uncharacterized protein n=1 Tax=Cladocopium goreaui TaxID=2562237 RepID=A0A9P1D7Y5_9DINO|nr:unnamed protein product [Cladocopium goreaui]